VSSNERRKELKRRRHRRDKIASLKRKLDAATPSEKTAIAEKIRRLSPGGEEIISRLGLDDR
jgi:hypothetical protein